MCCVVPPRWTPQQEGCAQPKEMACRWVISSVLRALLHLWVALVEATVEVRLLRRPKDCSGGRARAGADDCGCSGGTGCGGDCCWPPLPADCSCAGQASAADEPPAAGGGIPGFGLRGPSEAASRCSSPPTAAAPSDPRRSDASAGSGSSRCMFWSLWARALSSSGASRLCSRRSRARSRRPVTANVVNAGHRICSLSARQCRKRGVWVVALSLWYCLALSLWCVAGLPNLDPLAAARALVVARVPLACARNGGGGFVFRFSAGAQACPRAP